MNLAELLIAQATSRPDQAALIDVRGKREHRITFGELEDASARLAGLFHQSGLRAGDAVLVFQPMSIELYVALAALFRSGLLAMFLDPRTGRSHIEECCALCPPRGLIAPPKAHLLRFVSPALRRIPVQFSVGVALPWARAFSGWTQASRRRILEECNFDTPALVTFTSGSTGQPKAALRSHGFLLKQQQVLEKSLDLEPGEVDLATMPTFALANLASGLTTVITDAGRSSWNREGAWRALVAQIKRQRVDRIGASPAFFEQLVAHCSRRSESLPGVRKLCTGGGPVFPRLLDQLAAVAPQARIKALYGCTEAEPISTLDLEGLSPEDREATARGAGLPVGATDSGVLVRILPDRDESNLGPFSPGAFAAECLPPGSRGEIVVSGGHVLTGYLDGGEEAENKIQVGETIWHRTGDAGYFDGLGRLWLLGRCCGRVDDQHGRLYPLQVEGAIRQLTTHGRAALVSHAGRRRLWMTRQGRSELPVLSGILERWKIEQIRWIKAIPFDRRHQSKIDYGALRRLTMRAEGRARTTEGLAELRGDVPRNQAEALSERTIS